MNHHPSLSGAAQLAADVAIYSERLAHRQANRQSRGVYPSEKCPEAHNFTFYAQRDSLRLLELNHGVVAFETWAPAYHLTVGGVEMKFHPPIQVIFASGRRGVIGFSLEDNSSEHRFRNVEEAMERAFAALDVLLLFQSEVLVKNDPYLPTAAKLLRSVRTEVEDRDVLGIRRFLQARKGRARLGDLRDAHKNGSHIWNVACVLAMRRVLRLDVRFARPEDCLVSLPEAA